jgi:hypothetical protein
MPNMEQRVSHPSQWIVPIFSRGKSGPAMLEGTAFFLGTSEGVRAVTAAHVLKSRDATRDWYLAVPTGRDSTTGAGRGELQPVPFVDAKWHDQIDVGWIDAVLPRTVQYLGIMNSPLMFEWNVMCHDYSPGRPEQVPGEGFGFFADAWVHKGNIVRVYLDRGMKLMNTSFPLMQGASGSPILIKVAGDWYVAGMAIGNLEQAFAPSILAQTVTITDRDGTTENVNYFLPYGVAVSGEDLIRGVRQFFEPVLFDPPLDTLMAL